MFIVVGNYLNRNQTGCHFFCFVFFYVRLDLVNYCFKTFLINSNRPKFLLTESRILYSKITHQNTRFLFFFYTRPDRILFRIWKTRLDWTKCLNNHLLIFTIGNLRFYWFMFGFSFLSITCCNFPWTNWLDVAVQSMN